MRLLILGKSPSWQDADGACAGYLLEHAGFTTLIDCGNGVFSKLRRFHDYTRVDAVVISHLHADHFLDLVPYAYALTYTARSVGNIAPPRLLTPPGGIQTLRSVLSAWKSDELIDNAFQVAEYDASTPQTLGPLHFTFRCVPHFTETYAMRITTADGGGELCYGADCGPASDLVDLAACADLLLCEATLEQPEPRGPRGHLTPREAGAQAKAARVKRLVLTHLSDERDVLLARNEAAAAFGKPVEVAHEGAVYEL